MKAFVILLISIGVNGEIIAAPVTQDKRFHFFKSEKTSIEDPFSLRDPFRRKSFKRKAKRGLGLKGKKEFSNVSAIGTVSLDLIRVVGVLVGPERRAIAKIASTPGGKGEGASYLLREGMKLGDSKAEIKAILPGGIVVAEKILNVYDQEEYLETVIPVSE